MSVRQSQISPFIFCLSQWVESPRRAREVPILLRRSRSVPEAGPAAKVRSISARLMAAGSSPRPFRSTKLWRRSSCHSSRKGHWTKQARIRKHRSAIALLRHRKTLIHFRSNLEQDPRLARCEICEGVQFLVLVCVIRTRAGVCHERQALQIP